MFVPDSYFDDAKLLGLIDLGGILEGVGVGINRAPKLLESYGYGLLEGVGDNLATEIIKVAVGESNDDLGVFGSVRKGLIKFNSVVEESFSEDYPLKTLYPKLAQRIKVLTADLKKSSDNLISERDNNASPSITYVVRQLDNPVDGAETLIGEIGSVLENPIPEPIVRLIDSVQTAISSADDLLENPKRLINNVLKVKARSYICGTPPIPPRLDLDKETITLLFGSEPNCNNFPEGLFENINEAMFYEEFGELLETILLIEHEIEYLDFDNYIRKFLGGFLRHIETTVLARLSRGISDWCGSEGQLDGDIVILIDSVLGSFSIPNLQIELAPIKANILRFDLVTQKSINDKVLEFEGNIEKIADAQQHYKNTKTNWPANASLCVDAQKLFTPIAAVIKAYRNAAENLFGLLNLFEEGVGKIDLRPLENQFNTCMKGLVDSINKSIVQELINIIDIDAGKEPWSLLIGFVAAIDELDGYKKRITGLKDRAINDVKELKDAIDAFDNSISIEDKLKVLENLTNFKYSALIESHKRILSLPLASLALGGERIEKLVLDELVVPLAGKLKDIHYGTNVALEIFIEYAKPFEDLGLLNAQLIQRIKLGSEGIKQDIELLEKILKKDDVSLKTAYDMYSSWSIDDIALVSISELIGETVQQLGKGNLESVINTQPVKIALNQLESELKSIVTNFLPTSHVVEYDWETRLPNCIPEGNGIFKLIDPSSNTGEERKCGEKIDSKRYDDLVLKSSTRIDLLTGKISSDVSGLIKPFTIHLLGDNSDFAKIRFNQLTFVSKNGSSPKFDISVREVVLGKNAEFFKPLQDWLSPDSGFYITLGSNQIEAGYLLDLGIISFGTVSFLNVSLGVKAVLPFSDSGADGKGGALFGFNCGTVQKPIGVSIAPYGGLGHIEVLANSKGVQSIEVSLAFGAVVAFAFGPLNGQGRVVAGMMVRQDAEGLTIVGFFEAVGSASISCFSLTIRIRISLIHEGSNLTGEVDVSLKFKVGIFSISFNFTARQEIAGGGEEERNTALLETQLQSKVSDNSAVYSIDIPDKRTNWQDYKNKFDFDF